MDLFYKLWEEKSEKERERERASIIVELIFYSFSLFLSIA